MCFPEYLVSEQGETEFTNSGMFFRVSHIDVRPSLLEEPRYAHMAATARGLSALASAIADGALKNLEALHLYENRIGDDGLTALMYAVCNGNQKMVATLISAGSPYAHIQPENAPYLTLSLSRACL